MNNNESCLQGKVTNDSEVDVAFLEIELLKEAEDIQNIQLRLY